MIKLKLSICAYLAQISESTAQGGPLPSAPVSAEAALQGGHTGGQTSPAAPRPHATPELECVEALKERGTRGGDEGRERERGGVGGGGEREGGGRMKGKGDQRKK